MGEFPLVPLSRQLFFALLCPAPFASVSLLPPHGVKYFCSLVLHLPGLKRQCQFKGHEIFDWCFFPHTFPTSPLIVYGSEFAEIFDYESVIFDEKDPYQYRQWSAVTLMLLIKRSLRLSFFYFDDELESIFEKTFRLIREPLKKTPKKSRMSAEPISKNYQNLHLQHR
jgi:hypothetical protein